MTDPLPDPFATPDGGRIATPGAWPERAAAWRDALVDLVYGGLPPAPAGVRLEVLSESRARRLRGAPLARVVRIRAEGGTTPVSLRVSLLLPDAAGPVPVVAHGDGGWWNLSDEAVDALLARGLALAVFDRTEVAADEGATPGAAPRRRGGLYDAYPGGTFGALAAWAWAYHRCVDLLLATPEVDAARIAVTGFSRGGKAALLAGATDPRIGLVHDHASGAGGAAPFRYVGAGGETLAMVRTFPSWFGPDLAAYVGREAALPVDQHLLLAAIAPRPLLLTYAVDDRWSNPEGLVQSAWAAGEAYRFLGHPDALTFTLRPGGHAHTLDDWAALAGFVAWRWLGGAPAAAYGRHPYAGMAPVFAWRAPVLDDGRP